MKEGEEDFVDDEDKEFEDKKVKRKKSSKQ